MFFFFILLTPSTFLDQFGLSFRFLGYYSFCLSFIPSLIYLFISFSDIISFSFLSFFCFVDGKRIRKKNKKKNSKFKTKLWKYLLDSFLFSIFFIFFIFYYHYQYYALRLYYILYILSTKKWNYIISMLHRYKVTSEKKMYRNLRVGLYMVVLFVPFSFHVLLSLPVK